MPSAASLWSGFKAGPDSLRVTTGMLSRMSTFFATEVHGSDRFRSLFAEFLCTPKLSDCPRRTGIANLPHSTLALALSAENRCGIVVDSIRLTCKHSPQRLCSALRFTPISFAGEIHECNASSCSAAIGCATGSVVRLSAAMHWSYDGRCL